VVGGIVGAGVIILIVVVLLYAHCPKSSTELV
jgi:hypothetical protein